MYKRLIQFREARSAYRSDPEGRPSVFSPRTGVASTTNCFNRSNTTKLQQELRTQAHTLRKHCETDRKTTGVAVINDGLEPWKEKRQIGEWENAGTERPTSRADPLP